jgi:hypothetical protein
MATHDDAMELYNSMMAHWYPSDEDGEADEEEGQAELDENEEDEDEGEVEVDEDEVEVDQDQAELEDEDDDMPPLIPVQTPLYHYWYKTMAF